jgi:hypothetical protein
MTDFRALCARMADELDRYRQLLMDDRRETHALAAEARAALSQPELQGPSDKEWDELWDEEAEYFALYAEARRFGRAALARWGRPAIAPQGPTDEEINDWHGRCADLTRVGEADHYWAFDLQHDDVAGVVRAALARWGRPAIEPVPKREDVHYAWELHDAEGEWQAGGSANSLDDVQREGNRYLQTYSQHGPHKLIIERHCVTTIEPVPKQEAEQ